jgi:YHS domain-containing protein
MKKIIMVVFAMVLISSVALYAVPQTKCPVMGGDINKSISADHNGERVYFCCNGCPEQFKANPEKYLAKLKKSGVELEKVTTKKVKVEQTICPVTGNKIDKKCAIKKDKIKSKCSIKKEEVKSECSIKKDESKSSSCEFNIDK